MADTFKRESSSPSLQAQAFKPSPSQLWTEGETKIGEKKFPISFFENVDKVAAKEWKAAHKKFRIIRWKSIGFAQAR